MKNYNFGIEIEMTGLTRSKAARVLADYFGTSTNYDNSVNDQSGRKWKIEYDGSITPSGGDDTKVELVSPICTYEDIETIQEITRRLRKAGARGNSSTGIHIHVNGADHNANSLRNLTNIMVAKEDLLVEAIAVKADRMSYCEKADEEFIKRVNKRIPRTKEQFMQRWYEGHSEPRTRNYHPSRYRILNIHSMTTKGTVEFRCFNSQEAIRHAGILKAYIQLVLAINHQAITQKFATPRKSKPQSKKFSMRVWMIRMGMNGAEFKTARTHLLANLSGDTAFATGRPTATQNNEEVA